MQCQVSSSWRFKSLKAKLGKSAFFQREVCYLGHVISDQGVSTDPSKVEVVANCTPLGLFRNWNLQAQQPNPELMTAAKSLYNAAVLYILLLVMGLTFERKILGSSGLNRCFVSHTSRLTLQTNFCLLCLHFFFGLPLGRHWSSYYFLRNAVELVTCYAMNITSD